MGAASAARNSRRGAAMSDSDDVEEIDDPAVAAGGRPRRAAAVPKALRATMGPDTPETLFFWELDLPTSTSALRYCAPPELCSNSTSGRLRLQSPDKFLFEFRICTISYHQLASSKIIVDPGRSPGF